MRIKKSKDCVDEVTNEKNNVYHIRMFGFVIKSSFLTDFF